MHKDLLLHPKVRVGLALTLFFAFVLSFLRGLGGSMPGRRSLAAWTGWRSGRDGFYRTSHSKPGCKFVEVRAEEVHEIKLMARSRALHADRDEANGSASHFARVASLSAFRDGFIDQTTLKEDVRTHSRANAAKHTIRLTSGNVAAAATSPTVSGCLADRPEVRGITPWADVSDCAVSFPDISVDEVGVLSELVPTSRGEAFVFSGVQNEVAMVDLDARLGLSAVPTVSGIVMKSDSFALAESVSVMKPETFDAGGCLDVESSAFGGVSLQTKKYAGCCQNIDAMCLKMELLFDCFLKKLGGSTADVELGLKVAELVEKVRGLEATIQEYDEKLEHQNGLSGDIDEGGFKQASLDDPEVRSSICESSFETVEDELTKTSGCPVEPPCEAHVGDLGRKITGASRVAGIVRQIAVEARTLEGRMVDVEPHVRELERLSGYSARLSGELPEENSEDDDEAFPALPMEPLSVAEDYECWASARAMCVDFDKIPMETFATCLDCDNRWKLPSAMSAVMACGLCSGSKTTTFQVRSKTPGAVVATPAAEVGKRAAENHML